MKINYRFVTILALIGFVGAAVPALADGKTTADSKKGKVPSGNDIPAYMGVVAEHGILFGWNYETSAFTVYFKGKKVEPVKVDNSEEDQIFLSLDGTVVQLVPVEAAKYYKGDFSQLPDLDTLKAHQKWESDYLSHSLGMKLNIQESVVKDSKGKIYLLWEYEMPEKFKKNKDYPLLKQLYLVTRVKGGVAVLNSGLIVGQDEKRLVQKLEDVAFTLVEYPKPLTAGELKKMGLSE